MAAGAQVPWMRGDVGAACRCASGVNIRSARPGNRSGEMPSTWVWRTRMILVMVSSFRQPCVKAALARLFSRSYLMPADPNHVILTGENPFIRLSATDGGPNPPNASFWRIITCPAGPGHGLYLNTELTGNRWRIYADNIAMARWLQSTVQGMLNSETADTAIPVVEAHF